MNKHEASLPHEETLPYKKSVKLTVTKADNMMTAYLNADNLRPETPPYSVVYQHYTNGFGKDLEMNDIIDVTPKLYDSKVSTLTIVCTNFWPSGPFRFKLIIDNVEEHPYEIDLPSQQSKHYVFTLKRNG